MTTVTGFYSLHLVSQEATMRAIEDTAQGTLVVSTYLRDGCAVKFLRKGDHVGLYVGTYTDSPLPEWWRDAEVLFEHPEPGA